MATETKSKLSFHWFHATVLVVLSVTIAFGWYSLHITSIYLHSHDIPTSSKQFEYKESTDRAGTLHFCSSPSVHHSNVTLNLLYQCQGRNYDHFSNELHHFAQTRSRRTKTWGRRRHPLPAQSNVLALGNSHLRQVSKTLLCQYASEIESIDYRSPDVFQVRFTNKATWTSITNSVLVYSHQWDSLLQDFLLSSTFQGTANLTKAPLEYMDALVMGTFTQYQDALGTNFERTMALEQRFFSKAMNDPNQTLLDFASIPPPTLIDVAKRYPKLPLVSVSMFSASDVERMVQSRLEYKKFLHHNQHLLHKPTSRSSVHFINSRQYVERIHLECGSDDKMTLGDCHEPGEDIPNSDRSPTNMHRCSGRKGGHADLIAWDVIDGLFDVLLGQSGTL